MGSASHILVDYQAAEIVFHKMLPEIGGVKANTSNIRAMIQKVNSADCDSCVFSLTD